jgi:gamma-glutamylcyclotransferase (GGCT)/AIG2-like uncharacterized protein YtfP
MNFFILYTVIIKKYLQIGVFFVLICNILIIKAGYYTKIMPEYLFVYGALRKGMWAYKKYLEGHVPICVKRVPGFIMYTNQDRKYQFIVHGQGEITGEIYSIDLSKLKEIDVFKNYPDHYNRIKINVDGIMPWIYLIPSPENLQSAIRVPKGDWVEYSSSL